MDGFKTLPKMAHFKTGGHAKKEMCSGGAAYKKGGEVEDMAQDKKLIKKAFKQHDEAEHDKAPTEIKLRKGGRAKKELGSARKFIKAADAPSGAKKEPNKYKTGGAVGVYGAKKKSGDLDSIEKAKDIKPKKAEAPSGAKGPDAYKCGGKIKKMNDGRLVGALAGAASPAAGLAGLMAKREMEKKARAAKYLGASQQAELAQQQAAATAAQPQAQQSAPAPVAAPSPAAPPQDQMGNPTGMPAQKRGGKAGKGCK